MTFFEFQIQNGYRQQTNKIVFYARELLFHKQHLFIKYKSKK